DIRRDRPFAAYDELQVNVALYRYGDVRARMRVRMDEIHESIRLIREVHVRIPQGPITTAPTRMPASGEWALSAVEGWRGEILYFVMAGHEGTIHGGRVRDPWSLNWRAIKLAVWGHMLADFPQVYKSYN